jgi:putative oxidoreductase
MLSCDYNGWNDAPEDEREGLDRYFSDVVRPEVGTCHRPLRDGFSSAASVPPPRRGLVPVLVQMLELAMGALFLYLGGTKLLGSTAEVRLFHDYGWGQWFRYVTGVIELAGALLLIVPRLGRASALMTVMVVATGIELFVLHRPPMAATACLSAHGIIAWKRRPQAR